MVSDEFKKLHFQVDWVCPNGQAKTTTYLYDGRTLTAEADEHGNITAQYLYLGGCPRTKNRLQTP